MDMRDSWFRRAGLGLFVHWDHASQQGIEIGWPITGEIYVGDRPLRERFEAIPGAETANIFRGRFRSVGLQAYQASAASFDPTEWDAQALAAHARNIGARYAIFTTKHTSGYCMFHTRTTRRSIEHSPFGRDVVAEFTQAMRAAGLRVGLYFSLPDWGHPDYPAFTPELRPYRLGESPPLPEPERWERYLELVHAQLRELLSNYGRIDLLWLDGGWERSAAQWRASEIEALVRSLQPEIVLNDRLPGVAGYATPEQFVPTAASDEAWETCMTMGESWGFDTDDVEPKSARELVHRLCEVVARGGNLLLNVSPTGSGALPPAQVERLQTLSRWMARHAESVLDTQPGLDPGRFAGPSTRRGERLYLHLLARPYDSVRVQGVPVARVRRVACLGTGQELPFRSRTSVIEALAPDPSGELTIAVPEGAIDELASVLTIDFAPLSPASAPPGPAGSAPRA